MAYHKAAVDALEALGTAAVPSITKWIKIERSDLDFKPNLLKAALKKAVEKGTILQVKASYTLAQKIQAAADTVADAGPYSRLGRCPYKIEYAKSSRAYCRASRKTIAQGDMRLAPPMYKTGNDGDERTDVYALEALFEMFRDYPKDFWLSSPAQIAGFGALKPADQELVRGHIDALVAERTAAGVQPVYSPYTKPCWERRALMALMTNDKAAFQAALQEEGADVATQVNVPRLGSGGNGYLDTDVQIHHCGDGPTDHSFSSTAESVGLFYTSDMYMVWGASMYQGDDFLAFGEEMLVGYAVGAKGFEHKRGDTIVDLARKNGRAAILEGIDVLTPLLAAPTEDEAAASTE